MPSAEQIKALIRSYAQGNDAQFISIAMQVAAYEARRGHGKLAEELRELIDAAKERGAALPNIDRAPTPINRPRGELGSLVAASYPTERLTSMILSTDVHKRLARVIREQQHHTEIRSRGMAPRRKLLLVGPPGTGKTLTAAVIAGEMRLPLFQIRLDGLLSKFMGETAAKLRLVFDAISSTRAVYFFDEFDAIASQRGLGNDVGEVRRVLNSLLQFIEQDQSNSVIVAATNHPEILDYAVFRRFDDVIEYALPGPAQIVETLRSRLKTMGAANINWKALTREAAGLSYADVARAVDEAIKDAIIAGRETVLHDDVRSALADRRRIQEKQSRASVPRTRRRK